MKILFAAHEDAWGGVLGMLRKELPEHEFIPTGRFGFDTLKGFDVLIPTMTVVKKKHLLEADRLRLIQQCGVGLEGVDIEAAKSLNILVANVPADISGNADSVAELGIYLMLGLSRNVRQIPESFANGLMGYPRGRALLGKTVGIIGLGGIGRALAKRLKPFGARLVGIKRQDPQKAKEELGLEWAGTPAELYELLNMSDYVVLCLPLTDKSRNMMDSRSFRAMKRNAFLVNLSRGGLVDRDALEEALASGTIAGAGLDVFWQEPVNPNDPIFNHNVLATPHIGGATDVSIQGIMREVANNIRRLAQGQEPLYQM